MTEYQKQKLDELIRWLNQYHCSDCDDINDAIELAKAIREPPSEIETSAESSIMNAYFKGKRLELFQSINGTPFVCSGDDVYACAGMILDRFVELLGMRQAREEEGKS